MDKDREVLIVFMLVLMLAFSGWTSLRLKRAEEDIQSLYAALPPPLPNSGSRMLPGGLAP